MGFKRKRSVDESPVSACSFGSFATPEAQSLTPIASGHAMEMDAPMSRGTGWDFSNLGRVKSGEWIQRTRKRLRDNRPDERTIHGMHRTFAPLKQRRVLIQHRNDHEQTLLRPTQATTSRTHRVRLAALASRTCRTEATEIHTTCFLEHFCSARAVSCTADASRPRRPRTAM